MTTEAPTRHEKMVDAAVWLAEQGFADIGWAPCSDGKAPKRPWKSDASDDPARIQKMLRPGRNALVIPKGKAAIVDVDDPAAAVTLAAAGMPPGFRVTSPTPGHGHFYVWQNGVELPTNFAGGEIRRGGSGMVLGPWSLRRDGTYTPNGTHVIPQLPSPVAEVIVALRREKQEREGKALGPADDGWQVIHGRHDFLVRRARNLRGVGLTGERLVAELLRLRDERCAAPGGRVIEDAEVDRIAEWTTDRIGDDPPGVHLRLEPAAAPSSAESEAWPATPAEATYHGVLGDIALAVGPHTEADPVGVLGTLLAMFGAACGDGHALYQGSLQRANLSVLLVGATGFAGRKGTALDVARSVFRLAYPALDSIWLVGVASGEAITGHLGRHDGQEGRPDEHRVLIVEPEFGRVLTIMNREGSTLSAVLRNAWDGVPLGHARARDESLVTRHHVAMLGHVTPIELRQKLTDTDAANGFANRLLFLAVRRSRLIPFPKAPDELVRQYVRPLHQAIVEAQAPREMEMDEGALDRWETFYGELALAPRHGLAGVVTGRHEAQVARLALVYALADRSAVIGVAHLEAAIALAEYARRSVVWALGDSTGNRHADVLRGMLGDGEVGWDDAKRALGLRTAADMADAVAILSDAGLAEVVKVPSSGGGRPRRIIRAKGAKRC
jgi:hypothetical protein